MGQNTWRKADDRLSWTSGSSPSVIYDGWGSTGKVYFDRGSPWTAYDGGAYRLSFVKDDDSNTYVHFSGSHHIYHKQRTVTVS